MDKEGPRPQTQSTDHLSRRGFLASGSAAFAVLALGPGCALDEILGTGQQELAIVATLHAHEVNGFLVFETTIPSGELFAHALGTPDFVEWSAPQSYSIDEWDDGFVRAT